MRRLIGWVAVLSLLGCPGSKTADDAGGSGGGAATGGGSSNGGGNSGGGGAAGGGGQSSGGGGGSLDDAGTGGGVGGTGGGAGGTGGGAAGDGGPMFDAGFARPDPALFDAGWVDDGGILIGCEVDPSASTTPAECTPVTTGCQQASDCGSGLCLRLAAGHFCTKACAMSADCDPGWVCQRRWTGKGHEGFCVPAGRAP